MPTLLRLGATTLIECCALYLLSVLALLFGVYSAMNSPLFGGAGVAADLPLWSITHGYDLALLLVLGFLFAEPKRREDGYYVAMAAVALTLDPTLFTYRFYTHELAYGLTLGGLGAALAVVKMLTLAWLCRVPLSQRNLASLGVVYALVYLGHAPFNLAGFEAAPYLYLLAYTPLALAFLAPGPEDLTPSAEDQTLDAQVRAAEFRWVMLCLPFFGVALHLWQMPSVYDLASGVLHLGPACLAAVVLVSRFYPDAGERMTWLFVLAAGLSLASTAGGAGTFEVAPRGFEVTPLRIMWLAHAGVSAYLALRYRRASFAIYAGVTGLVFVAGSTPADLLRALWGPLGWTGLSVLTVLDAHRRGGYEPTVRAFSSTTGLVACLLTGDVVGLWTVHLTGLGCLYLQHAFEGELDRNPAGSTLVLYGMLAQAYLVAIGSGWTPQGAVLLAAEVGLLVAGAVLTTRARYRAGVGAGASLALVKVFPLEWLLKHEAALGLGAAFAFLAAGFWVSLHKEALLEGLEEAPLPTPSPSPGE